MSDYKNVAMVNNPLVYWPSFTGGQLIKEFNEKNQRSAASLYIAPGFAHYKSQAACNELI